MPAFKNPQHGRDHLFDGSDPIIGFNPVPITSDPVTEWLAPFEGQVVLGDADVTAITGTGTTGGSGEGGVVAYQQCFNSGFSFPESLTIGVPAITTGQLAVVIASQGWTYVPSPVSMPSGWSEVFSQRDGTLGTENEGLHVYKHIAASDEGITNYTWNWGHQVLQMVNLLIFEAGNDVLAHSVWLFNGNPADSPDVSAPAVPSELFTVYFAPRAGDNWASLSTPLMDVVCNQNMGRGYGAMGVFKEALSSTGSTGTRSAGGIGYAGSDLMVTASLVIG